MALVTKLLETFILDFLNLENYEINFREFFRTKFLKRKNPSL